MAAERAAGGSPRPAGAASAPRDPSGDSSGHRHDAAPIERHCDVVVLGTSPGALAAAGALGRRGRSVIVVEGGEGVAPGVDAGAGPGRAPRPAQDRDRREEVRRHGGEILAARATGPAELRDGGVRVQLTGGHVVLALAALVDAAGEADGLALDRELVLGGAADRGNAGSSVGPRRSANEADWDRRYSGDALWSGAPNGTLVAEVTGLAPGRALDVGSGEGGDAIWLAGRGWQVTAADISARALDRVAAQAARGGLDVTCRHADANTPGAFPAGAYDLVSAQYASIPRTPEDSAVANIIGAVAPGGTLLVVGHDLAPMRAPIDLTEHGRAFDPDAYVRVDDFAAALRSAPGWTIEVHELRPRPPGAASSHHVDDVVLRARREG